MLGLAPGISGNDRCSPSSVEKRETKPVTQPSRPRLRSLAQLSGYLRPHGLTLLFALIALLLTSSAVLGMGAALRFLVDEGLGKGNPDLLDNAYFVMLGVIFVLAGASFARVSMVLKVGEQVVAAIRRDVFSRVVHMDVAYFEMTRTGDIISRITTDTTILQTLLSSSVSFAIRNLIMAVGGITMLIITSPTLTGYLALIVPVVLVPIVLLGRHVRRLSRESQQSVADISAHAEETVFGIRTVQALSLERFETGRFEAHVKRTLDLGYSRINAKAWLYSTVIALVFGAVITVLWFGGRDVLAGSMTAGALSAFIFYAIVVASAMGALSEASSEVQQAAGAAERLMELTTITPGIVAPPQPVPLPDTLRGEVVFDNILFHYPSRPDRAALEDLSLSVAPGETVALVGHSGAGKTTLFQLLLRFYDPRQGAVLIDGIDVRDLDPHELRRHIGLVPQDPIIFSANGWDNIRCGRPDASAKEVIMAAEAASALEFLERLPEGFDTHLGEKGVRLSGGQKQRVAIARAIVRNPRILLLDEATSALDAEHELQVRTAMANLMQGRTTLVIAHRLSTVMRADRIVVMQHGRIEAIGTHADLMQTSPLYARLATLQLSAGV